ncbi:MAG: tetratricopeptide repeat protein [Actinomycetota bacterium]
MAPAAAAGRARVGFWLGFIFTSSPKTAAALLRRVEHLMRFRGRATVLLRPEEPAVLAGLLPAILRCATPTTGCVWVEAVRSDPPGSEHRRGGWTAAWEELLIDMNERRDTIRRSVAAGLVLAAPQHLKVRARTVSPDLWAVRSLVMEMPGSAGKGSIDLLASPPARGVGLETHEPASGRPRSGFAVEEDRPLADELRRVESLLAQGQAAAAARAGERAVEGARARGAPPSDLALAFLWLARAEEAEGDRAAAAEHLERALALKPDDPALRVELLDMVGELATERADLDRATAVYEESLSIRRRLVGSVGETPTALRDLSVSLDNVGQVRREAGDLSGATAAYEEARSVEARLAEVLKMAGRPQAGDR